MVFNFETFVKVVVCTSVVIFSSGSNARSSGDKNSTENQKSNGFCDFEGYVKAKKEKSLADKELQDIWDACVGSISSAGPCSEAEKEYNDAKGEFEGACGMLPGSQEKSGEVGDLACTGAILKCQCRFKNLPGSDATRIGCPSDVSASSGELINLRQARQQFANCPMLAATDINQLENELKERRKELREMQKKIPELQDGIAEAQNQAAEKDQELGKQMVDAAKEHGQQQKDAKREMEEAQNQLAQQLLQLQEEITKLEEQRGEIRMQRSQANVKRVETISAIELNCHKSASDKVDELQRARLALEEARGYNRGGFAQMLKAVGVSDRDAWQRVAKKYYNWCIQSTPTRKAKEAANKIYETEQRAADERDRDLDRKRSDIASRMSKIKNSNGCTGSAAVDSGGESTESALCQAARRAAEDQARIDRDYIAQRNQLAQARAQANAAGARKAMAKGAALAEAQGEISSENARLRNLEQFLALKRSFSGGKRLTEQDTKDVFKKFGALVGKAKQVLECKQTGAKPNESCANSKACYEAINFLAIVGDKQQSEARAVNDARKASSGEGATPASKTTIPSTGGAEGVEE